MKIELQEVEDINANWNYRHAYIPIYTYSDMMLDLDNKHESDSIANVLFQA